MTHSKLPREFYARDTIMVAKDLLGTHLIHEINGVERIGKIVEVERTTCVKEWANKPLSFYIKDNPFVSKY